MEFAQTQGPVEKNNYFEVFDHDKEVRIGIASAEDKREIEEKYPDEYHFEEFDYDLEKQNLLKPASGLTFDQIIILILVALLVICVIAGLIWPDRYSFIHLYLNTTH